MKIRVILALIVTAFLGILLFTQANLVKAQNVSGAGPNSYAITGKVLYRYQGLYRPATSATVEAKGDHIKANDPFKSYKYTTIVDRLGNYSLIVPAGEYTVRAFDKRDTIFLPLVRYVTASTSANINFTGMLKLWF